MDARKAVERVALSVVMSAVVTVVSKAASMAAEKVVLTVVMSAIVTVAVRAAKLGFSTAGRLVVSMAVLKVATSVYPKVVKMVVRRAGKRDCCSVEKMGY